jgi:glycosyltransferase involved in cell wall biosynthesis
MRVAHLTSVHVATDPRILHKQCATLARHGYAVVLIAPHHGDEMISGVRIRAISRERGRLRRMTKTVLRVYRAAVEEDCDLYHFHDPELIPVGLALRLRGKPVVYDVHEDYRTSIAQKSYLPNWVRALLAKLLGFFESWASSAFHVVLAERYYQQRFPSGTLVLNYPLASRLRSRDRSSQEVGGVARLLYTGVVSEDRGALNHARLVHLGPDVEVHVIGRCSPELARRMRVVAGAHQDRLHIIGEGYSVPYERILEAYEEGNWLAGLALFPPTPHYWQKELTKFFEYMAAEIPVLCSNFPVWRRLIEGAESGLCVDPEDPEGVRAAIDQLILDRRGALMMGRRGQEAVEAQHNWARQAERLVELYRSILGAPVKEPIGASR